MQANQSGPQAAPGNPVTWQVVNPETNIQPETQSKPKRRRGTAARTCTSIFQASLGAVLIVAGIIVLSVVVPSPTSYPLGNAFDIEHIELRDKRSWGIWCGALFIFTAVFGFFSRRSQVVISLYMAFSIFAALLAFCGIVSSGIQLGHLASAKKGLDHSYSSYSNPCKPGHGFEVGKDTNGTECVPRYHYIQCVSIHKFEQCVEETRPRLTVHLVFHAIMLICFVAEFVISIVGASLTCIGLECCSRTQQRQHVIYYQTQVPPFVGQPGVPPGAQVFPPHQYPVSMPPPAGLPVAAVPQVVQHTSPAGQDEYLIPDSAPPPYQPQADQQEYAYAAEEPFSHSPSAPPSYEPVNPGEGNNSSSNPLYITVEE